MATKARVEELYSLLDTEREEAKYLAERLEIAEAALAKSAEHIAALMDEISEQRKRVENRDGRLKAAESKLDSLERQLKMKRDDWLEVCKENDALQSRLGDALNLAKLIYRDCPGELDLLALRLIETLEGQSTCDHTWIAAMPAGKYPSWECAKCGTHKIELPENVVENRRTNQLNEMADKYQTALGRLGKAMDARNELSDCIWTFGGTGIADDKLHARLEQIDDMLVEALGSVRPNVGERRTPICTVCWSAEHWTKDHVGEQCGQQHDIGFTCVREAGHDGDHHGKIAWSE